MAGVYAVRTRSGNPGGEAHGHDLRVYDWVAPAGTDPHEAAVQAEAALGVKLGATISAERHGYVTTSRRPDGALYVCVCLYDFTCEDDACDKGEGAIVLKKAPDVTANLDAMKKGVGEHDKHKLGVGNDEAVLTALRFATAEAKLAARGSKHIETVDAVTARCAECGAVAMTDGPLR